MIDRLTIEKILDAAQIVDVVSDFVTLRKRGVNYVGLCPFHNEKTPSFSVSPSKGLCKCFSCGKGGTPVHFIMEHEQMSYPEALRYLANKYHIEIQERSLTDEERRAQSLRESMFIANSYACTCFQELLRNTPEGQNIGLAYFRERGFRDDIIQKFQLGYCLSKPDAFATEALSKGYSAEILQKTGLCYQRDDGSLRDRFWGRVIFPVHTLSGKVIAFGGRVLRTDSKTAKYVNSPESEIYHKSNELYGIFFAKSAIVKQDRCFLVEGYTDVISMHQAGIENVVASSGTSLTTGQIKLIHRFTDNITVLYDGDRAGIKASIRGIDMLLEEGMNIKVVLLPDGDDPDSFARKHNATDYQAYITSHEVDFIRFKTSLLLEEAGADPIQRAALITDIVKSIAVIPNDITRTVYTHECSQLMQVDERIIVEEIRKMRKRGVKASPQPTQPAPQPTAQPQQPPRSAPEQTPGKPQTANEAQQTTTAQSQQTTQQETVQLTRDTRVARIEEELARLLVRFGDTPFAISDDGKELIVANYIAEELAVDDIEFRDERYRVILAEALQGVNEEDDHWRAQRHFLSHPDPVISQVAVALSNERYELSRYHYQQQHVETDEEKLYEILPTLMGDYKYALISERCNALKQALRTPGQGDDAYYMNLLRQYKELSDIQKAIARQQGDRTLI